MTLGQGELYFFKLPRINTGELQLKFLCKFSEGKKIGQSLAKKKKKKRMNVYSRSLNKYRLRVPIVAQWK